ncbi:MAG: hypothetical protein OXH81_11105 [Gemmatimonadetes bacterium]|nr:hypothetical protein [Gemmatimonadota bacterium]
MELVYPILSVISFVIALIALFLVWRFHKRQVLEPNAEVENADENARNGRERDAEEIEWLKSLKVGLKESVSGAVLSGSIGEDDWRELQERRAYLSKFQSVLEKIQGDMSEEDRASFAAYVEREVEKPRKQIQDLLTLRDMQNAPNDPVLLLKGALLGGEILDAASIAGMLRRTRPGQMVRYFLSEIDSRVTKRDGQRVFDGLMDLGGDEVEIIGAYPGDQYDMSRYQIVGQDTSGAYPRDHIVRCVAHGLKNSQTGEIELKAKVIIAG